MRQLLLFLLCILSLLSTSIHAQAWRRAIKAPEAPRIPTSGRTHIITQAELKYGLMPFDSYYDRWVDYPLLTDPELQQPPTHEAVIHFPDFRQMVANAKNYGLEAFAMFPNYFAYEHTQGLWHYAEWLQDPTFKLVPLLHPIGKEFQQYTDMVVNSPAAWKIHGKNVFPLVGDPKLQAQRHEFLTKKYGDRFIFFSYFNINALHPDFFYPQFGYREGRMTVEYAKLFQEKLRERLRHYDGLMFEDAWAMNMDHGMREPYWEFYRNFVIPAIKAVYSEPEFKGKYLWMSAFVGHENPSFIGYHVSCNGTRNLRRNLEAAIDAGADVINIAEWDEQNENTSLRPTIYNSTAHLRIMRYYTSRLRHQKLKPLPKDDLSLPNLIFSVRKVIAMGEMIRMELLNVPDGGPQRTYRAVLTLTDLETNRECYRSPAITFHSQSLQDHQIQVPSENFSLSRALLPAIIIQEDNKQDRHLSSGLQAIDLRPVWNWDYKWTKQPIRDVAWNLTCDFKRVNGRDQKEQQFHVSMHSPEPLANSDLFDNQLVVYSHSRPGTPLCRETKDTLVFRVSLLSVQEQNNYLNMSFSLDHGDLDAITRTRMWREDVHRAVQVKGGKVICKSLQGRWIAPVFFLTTKRENLSSTLTVQVNGKERCQLPLKQLMTQQAYGLSLEKGTSIVLTRYLQQWDHPAHLNTPDVSYEVNTLPAMPDSLFFAQAITKTGKVWRSRPLAAAITSDQEARKKVTVWSETQERPIELEVPAYRVRDLIYVPSPSYGSLMPTAAGRLLWGIRGGFVQQAMGRGGCENDCYGNVFSDGARDHLYPAEAGSPAPEIIQEGSERFMRFNGINSFIAFPQGVLPKRAGFQLTMSIRPRASDKPQFLLGNTNALFGGGLQSVVLTPQHTLQCEYISHNMEVLGADNSSVFSLPCPLKLNQWNDLKLVHDLKTMQLTVNGKITAKVPCPGPARFDTLTMLGGFQTFFRGDIKNLIIKHAQKPVMP